jgi:hypothetical protein
MHRLLAASLILVAALAAGGCDNGPDPNRPTPPAPTVTETFSGTLNLNGAVTHPFSAQAAGSVTATITAVDPIGSLVGLELGTFNGTVCSAILSNPLATTASFLTGTTQTRADLCVRIHDPNGTLTAGPVNYTIQVVHP